MAKKNDSISINKLEKYCKQNSPKEVTLTFTMDDGEELSCVVKTRLSLEETLRFIEEVVSESVSPEDMMIVPVARDYVFGKCILTYYGNFTMPANATRAYEMVMACADIIAAIEKKIDAHQLGIIHQCIHERIEFEKQKMVSGSEYQANVLMGKIREMTDKMEAAFGGVSGEQISPLINRMNAKAKDTPITAQDLAAAIVAR